MINMLPTALPLHFHRRTLESDFMPSNSDVRRGFLRLGLLMLLLLLALPLRSFAADTNAASGGNDDTWRASILLQEQLRQTQLAIERNRLDAEALAASNAAAFAQRLDSLEKNIATQRSDDINKIEQSQSRTIMLFAGVMLLVLIVASYFQWSAINRLASAAAGLALSRPTPMLGMGEGQPQSSQLTTQSSTRFLDVIERLEQRIHHFELSSKGFPAAPEHGTGIGAHMEVSAKALPTEEIETAERGVAEKASLLVGKSQTLMKMNKPEAALAALDEALSIDPENADAFIKKGTVLENLDRMDEAIRCFDMAIALDRSTTMAYLYKGALFNRMQRYNESLACYEQALRANDRRPSTDFSVQPE
jgi:tetratricopeptide (TPR) repeat protein